MKNKLILAIATATVLLTFYALYLTEKRDRQTQLETLVAFYEQDGGQD